MHLLCSQVCYDAAKLASQGARGCCHVVPLNAFQSPRHVHGICCGRLHRRHFSKHSVFVRGVFASQALQYIFSVCQGGVHTRTIQADAAS